MKKLPFSYGCGWACSGERRLLAEVFSFQTDSSLDVSMSLSAWSELVSVYRGARVHWDVLAHAQGFCCLEKWASEVVSHCNLIFTQLVLAQGNGTGACSTVFSGEGKEWGGGGLISMMRSVVAGGWSDKEGAVQNWTQYDKKARWQQAGVEGRLKKVAGVKLKTLGIFGHMSRKVRDFPAAASCGRSYGL